MAAASASPRRWAALFVLLAGGFMDLLDTTIVNVAVPSIRQSLGSSYAELQWIVAGYLLAAAVGLITGGRLGDAFGRRRVFVAGVLAFGVLSLSCGLAPSSVFLVVARILQGLAAALMIPQIMATIQVTFPRAEQRRALALYSAVAGLAVMSGPLLAGLVLTGFGLSWRALFLINVPVSLIAAGAAVALVPESRSDEARRLDLGGVALVSAALFALVFGLIEGRELGWPAWADLTIAASVPLFALFALHERRTEQRARPPLVSMSLFRQRAFAAGLGVTLVLFSGLVGFLLAFTIFLQVGLGYTPLQAALTTFPSSAGLILASLAATRLIPAPGRRVLAFGALAMAAAMSGLILTVDHYGTGLTPWAIRPVLFVYGLAMGLILPPLGDVVIAGVRARNAGAVSGAINTGMQVGGAIGVVLTGVILFGAIGGHAARSAAQAVPATSAQLVAIGLRPAARRRALQEFEACFVATANGDDPAAVATSCGREVRQLAAPRIHRSAVLLAGATIRARKDDFVAAIRGVLAYEVAVFLAASALLLLLPPTGATDRVPGSRAWRLARPAESRG